MTRTSMLRQALESKKTTSRKARSKQSSAASSRTASPAGGSRPGSRITSREPSDDEDLGSEFSDGDAGSTTSIDGVLTGAAEELEANWETELHERIARISNRNRKGGSAAGRAEDLAFYVSVLRGRYIKDLITPQLSNLYSSFLKYLRPDSGEIEQLLALEAIAVTTVTAPSSAEGLAYEACAKPLQALATDSDSERVKESAIQALTLVTFLSAADETAEEAVMPILASIVESDGVEIAAQNSPEVVSAALQAWSLLATVLDDAEGATSEAMEAIVDQLDSAHAAVQLAAGEAIALIYEKSYTDLESDEEPSDDESTLNRGKTEAPLVKRYTPYRRKDQLLEQLNGLSNLSTRSRNKKDRKELHAIFTDISKSVDDPRRGPGYSDAIDQETGREYGSRLKFKIGGEKMVVKDWWKLIRLRAMKRWLQGGLPEHYRKNEALREILDG